MYSISQSCRQPELPLLGRTFKLHGKELRAAVLSLV